MKKITKTVDCVKLFKGKTPLRVDHNAHLDREWTLLICEEVVRHFIPNYDKLGVGNRFRVHASTTKPKEKGYFPFKFKMKQDVVKDEVHHWSFNREAVEVFYEDFMAPKDDDSRGTYSFFYDEARDIVEVMAHDAGIDTSKPFVIWVKITKLPQKAEKWRFVPSH